ncbi:MAG: hypothetical protein HRU42_19580 [Shewanella sp.]|nr:hypothetical protein [Shewanella sp.]
MPSSSSGSVTGTSTDGRYDLSWSAVSNASYYQIIITDENGTQRIIKVIGTHYSLAGLSLGSNKIEIQACNASNQCGVSYLAGTVSRSSKVRYQHTDMLGTPVMETDESGNVISRSVYEPFGKRLGGEKVGLGFTGHLQDEDLGLTYMQARYYDPVIGRFYSNDPVGYTYANPVMSFNRYLYVNNNPYKYTDPNGEFLWGAVIGAAIDYGMQVGSNLSSGQSLGDSLTNIDGTSIVISAGLGMVGSFGGGKALTSAAKLLSNQTKGKIGEGVTRLGIAARGEKVIAAQAKAGNVQQLGNITGRAANSRPDFVVQTASGAVKVVEAKFGTAGLTGAQRQLKKQIGKGAFQVSRTSYDDVARAGSATGAATGGATGNCAASANSACN